MKLLSQLRDPEFREAAPLFAIGAAQGFFRYYVQPEITAKRGWFAVLGLAAAIDVAAPKSETLSEGVDRALDANRALTTLAVGYTAAHLLNLIPQPDKFDLFHIGLKALKR